MTKATSPLALTIISSENLHSFRSFSVCQERYRIGDSKVFERAIVKHNGAAVILPRLDKNTLLMVKQFRLALRQEILEFPAGTINPGEEPSVCAGRELIEETSHAAGNLEALGSTFAAPGFCDEKQHFFYADNLSKQQGKLDVDEILQVVEVPLAQIDKMIQDGTICDSKSIVLYHLARSRGLV